MEPYHLRLRVVQNSFQRLGGRWWITRKPKELKVFISRIVLPNQDRVWEYSCYLTQLIIRISTFHMSITQKLLWNQACRVWKAARTQPPYSSTSVASPATVFHSKSKRPLLLSQAGCSMHKTPTDLMHCLYRYHYALAFPQVLTACTAVMRNRLLQYLW